MKLNKWKVLELMIAKRIENQAELAKRIGVTRQALSNWMSGISFPRGLPSVERYFRFDFQKQQGTAVS